MTRKGQFIARAVFVALFFLGATIQQPGYAVTISNGEFTVHASEGDVVTTSFTVGNNEGKSLNFEIKAIDWHRNEVGGVVFEQANANPRSIASWVELDSSRFVLSPDNSREVGFTVTVPQGVTGTYWGGFLIDIKTESDTQQGQEGSVGLQIGTSILVKVFVKTPINNDQNGQIVGINRLGVNPFSVEVAFANTGNVELQNVSGRVEIRNLTGDTIRSIPIRSVSILPGDTRNIRVVDDNAPTEALPPGNYVALAILDIGLDTLLGGQLVFSIDALSLHRIGDAASLPQDVDRDGFYEDIDGDGVLTDQDVQQFKTQFESAEVQNNWRAFDFNNDGKVDKRDVGALRSLLQA